MEDIRRLAELLNAENAERKASLIWQTLHKKYVASAAINATLNIAQLALSGSVVALNIYVTRFTDYQIELFVAIVVLVSVITLMSSLALFLKLRARARRNRVRYVLAVREATLYRQKKGYYGSPKTRDERIVKRLAQIRSWKSETEHAE